MKHRYINILILITVLLLSLGLASCRKPKEDPTTAPTTLAPATEEPTSPEETETDAPETTAGAETTAETTPVPTTEEITPEPTDGGEEGGMDIDDEYTIDISDGETGGGL